MFFEFYKSFKQKFSEIKELQDHKGTMMRVNADPVDIQRTKFQIKNGILTLKDYIKKMDKAILLIKDKNKNFDITELNETVERCTKLIDVLERKDIGPAHKTTENMNISGRKGLSRDEQLLLENWEEQMGEIVC